MYRMQGKSGGTTMSKTKDTKIASLKELPHQILKQIATTGVIENENERSASFIHMNQNTRYENI